LDEQEKAKDLYKEMPSMIVKKIIEKINEDPEATHALLRTSHNIHEIVKVENDIQIKTVTFKIIRFKLINREVRAFFDCYSG